MSYMVNDDLFQKFFIQIALFSTSSESDHWDSFNFKIVPL